MTDLFGEPDDATPLAAQERQGLRQSWITSRGDLNRAEEDNIVDGSAWARARRSRRPTDVLMPDFARRLHRKMFGDVWKWAGSYRTTARNIGIDAHRIDVGMVALFDDARCWADNETYPPDEIAVRLHHRLVIIHPFPNGNGRHARLMADLLIERLGGSPFGWDGGRLAGGRRPRMGPLLAFARS